MSAYTPGTSFCPQPMPQETIPDKTKLNLVIKDYFLKLITFKNHKLLDTYYKIGSSKLTS